METAEDIPHLVCPEKKPRFHAEAPQPSPTQAPAVAKVLDDDDLLTEIIVRVGFPTTLVHVALVCKRWLAHASDSKSLSRFRKLHPPRLLGYYITKVSVLLDKRFAPRFVPMLPQPPELATVIRRAESYNFDGYGGLHIMDCRSGSIITRRYEEIGLTHVVHRPLCPHRSMDIVPPLPSAQDHSFQVFGKILSKDVGTGLCYLYVLGESTGEAGKSMARVYVLQDGAWKMHTSATCPHSLHFGLKALLVNNNIYVPTCSGYHIIVLDLTASSFSTFQLPRGVKYHYFKSMLSRADDASSVYFIHVEEFQLRVWLHKGDNWLLVDTICLHEMLAILVCQNT
uniref:Uncharacterized protein n=1 Tax=Avena sativa TaxID=4498 RepID=A0ACD5Z9M2_AVESA